MKAPETPLVKYRKDYLPPAYFIDSIALRVELGASGTEVQAELAVRRNPASTAPAVLELDGEQLELLDLAVDGRLLSDGEYRLGVESLSIPGVPERFVLATRVRIHPECNTALSGLYTSGGKFCTQCEAEGFRRITYFPDRPDIMAKYRCTIVADKLDYPFLLSNGNPVARGELDQGRHYVTWDDPFPKPCYLFALVAGDLDLLEDEFITRSGRRVALQIYVDKGQLAKCPHAMASLKKAMAWDEARFGLEYDLDIYMIVAVSDFNMGAMENKGLNIFNTKYVLADVDTATDVDFDGVESVIGHEYFHNWTGNRVTCRDWFQLSLKEGLTVYRDQEFTSDVQSRAVKRIDDVKVIRSVQFSEDAGPMAHPIRPDAYIEMNNFYTSTVYNKGAEVIRMLETLIGREAFRRGMDLYFSRHDGQAVTCDEFVQAMADASGRDLSQFRRWYAQAGTPELVVRDAYDAASRVYTLHIEQRCPDTPGQKDKQPFLVPIKMGLLDGQGAPLIAERVLELTENRQSFRFEGMACAPIPVLLRDFSAPVKLDYPYSDEQLALIYARDGNAFARWDAGQRYALRLVTAMIPAIQRGETPAVPEAFVAAIAGALRGEDQAFAARAIALPDENIIAETLDVVDVDAVRGARERLRRVVAERLREPLLATYGACEDQGEYRFEAVDVGRRALRNACLHYLMALPEPEVEGLCRRQYEATDNMTERFAALRELVHQGCASGAELLADFERRYAGDALVMDKWFAVQASAPLPGILVEVKRLMTHPAFSLNNPNKVRSLIGAFAMANPTQFHAADGSGYRFLAEQLVQLQAVNPQIAARMTSAFNRWKKYLPARQAQMQGELRKLVETPDLAKDVFEIASKALA
ncbi:MAG: aminopeptidase N [Gammaproteobacteria bacterium]|nr:aminopeptidase N [Gammaproteobacteria bacterium]